MGRIWVVTALLAMTFLAIGCGGEMPGSSGVGQDAPTDAANPPLSQIAVPDSLGSSNDRVASILLGRDGSDYLAETAINVASEENNARFSPSWPADDGSGALACAIYSFNLEDYDGSSFLELTWDGGETPNSLWVGLSNWDHNRWDWYAGSDDGLVVVSEPGITVYAKPETSELLAAVVLLGTESELLTYLYVGEEPVDPVEITEITPAEKTGIVGVPMELSVLFSGNVGHNLSYLWDFGSAATPTTSTDPNPEVTFGEPGVHQCSVTVSNGEGSPASRTFACSISSATAPHPWPMFGHDPQRTGRSPVVGAQNNTLKWAFRTTGAGMTTHGTAVDTDGTVYISAGSEVIALNPDGTIKWYSDTKSRLFSPPVLANGTIYVHGYSPGNLYALATDGSEIWSYPTGGGYAPAIGSDGTIYVGSVDKHLHAINPDGTLKWSFAMGGYNMWYAPVVAPDGTVFIAEGFIQTGNYHLYAVNPDGSLKWSVESGQMFRTPPVIGADGTVYFAHTGTVFAYDPDGNQQWMYKYCSWVTTLAFGSDGVIYAGGATGDALAINPDGTLKWAASVGDDDVHSPALGPGSTLYVGEGTDLFALDLDGNVLWSCPATGEAFAATGFGDDGTIYAQSWYDKFYAINPDGSVAWTYCAGGPVASSPAVAGDGTVYFGSNDDRLYALNPDGSLKWAADTGEDVSSSPAIDEDGTVYVGNNYRGSAFMAFNPDGSEKWSLPMENGIVSSPVIDPDGTVYLGGHTGESTSISAFLKAVNPDGSIKWSYDGERGFGGSPAIGSDGTVYAGGFDNLLKAINSDGVLLWQAESADSTITPAIGTDGTVYAGDEQISAFDPAGIRLWRNTEGRIHTSPAIGPDGTLYFGNALSTDNRLFAINKDGTEKWSFIAGGSIYSSGAVGADGVVYFGCDDGKFYALNPDGTELWSYQTGGAIKSSPAIGADGTVYIGSSDGKLYAFGPGPGV